METEKHCMDQTRVEGIGKSMVLIRLGLTVVDTEMLGEGLTRQG